MRERRPGVWEIPVVVDVDERTGVSVQQSSTVHGARRHAARFAASGGARGGRWRLPAVGGVGCRQDDGRGTVGPVRDGPAGVEAGHALVAPVRGEVVGDRSVVPVASGGGDGGIGPDGDRPMAGVGCVDRDGVGAVAGAAFGVVLGSARTSVHRESAARYPRSRPPGTEASQLGRGPPVGRLDRARSVSLSWRATSTVGSASALVRRGSSSRGTAPMKLIRSPDAAGLSSRPMARWRGDCSSNLATIRCCGPPARWDHWCVPFRRTAEGVGAEGHQHP